MGKTQPLKELEQINELKEFFLEREEIRNYALVVIGLNTSLRISDILTLKWKDVYNFNSQNYRHHLQIVEKKTQKRNIVVLNEALCNALDLLKENQEYIAPDRYLFLSRKGENRPITRNRAFTIIKEAANNLGFEDTVSCHSLRKTFGYQAWKQGVQPALLMSIYHHSSYEITKRYLGINQDERDEVFLKIRL